MDARPTAPGEGSSKPLVADQPLPPGSNAEEIVDELDARIRRGGPDEIKEADEQADAVEDQDDNGDSREEEASDSDSDPTDDGREQDEQS
ncbi:hypothetical protein [Ornithinicoccus halotolerans]|uniref:hypothetical protein n=1 Tax=Ornithinicoccus halotolerans TaxID=1748220 RepID=UPI001296EB22|nr:hypothetical protein [Ornithinicoccus halotolerans]